MTTSTHGFSLVEVLITASLFVVVMMAVSALTLNSLSLNKDSQEQLRQTTTAQQLIENVRAAWNTTSNYDRACAAITVPAGYRVTSTPLNSRGAPTGAAAAIRSNAGATPINCAAQTASNPAPPMRRLTVTGPAGPEQVTLNLSVLRPE